MIAGSCCQGDIVHYVYQHISAKHLSFVLLKGFVQFYIGLSLHWQERVVLRLFEGRGPGRGGGEKSLVYTVIFDHLIYLA